MLTAAANSRVAILGADIAARGVQHALAIAEKHQPAGGDPGLPLVVRSRHADLDQRDACFRRKGNTLARRSPWMPSRPTAAI
jgi:hypothetical protein